jgi:hypothetical protein
MHEEFAVRGFDGMAFVDRGGRVATCRQVDLAGHRVTKRARHRINVNDEVFTSRKMW